MALEYVRAHLPDVDFATLAPPRTSTVDGVSTVSWRPSIDGIPAGDHELRVNVAGDRVLNVADEPEAVAGIDTTPALTAGEAVRAAQDAVGVFRSLARTKGPAGATRATAYGDDTKAELALWGERLAWRVTYRAASDAVWDVVVDADNGRVVKRANLVKSDVPAKVWENYPGSAAGGTATDRGPRALADGRGQAARAERPRLRRRDRQRRRDRGRAGHVRLRHVRRHRLQRRSSRAPGRRGRHWQTNRKQNAVQAFYLANRFHDHLRRRADRLHRRAFDGDDPLRLETDDGAATGRQHATTRTCTRRRTAPRRSCRCTCGDRARTGR